jgi:hypothetical protein
VAEEVPLVLRPRPDPAPICTATMNISYIFKIGTSGESY